MKLLKLIIIFVLCIYSAIPVMAIEKQQIYQLLLEYKDGNLTLKEIKLNEGYVSSQEDIDYDYIAKIISFENDVLYSYKFKTFYEASFAPNPEWFDEKGNQVVIPKNKGVEEKYFARSLSLPYFKNAKLINTYNEDNEKVLEINVSHFSDDCGDLGCVSPRVYQNKLYVLVLFLMSIVGLILFFIIKRKGRWKT